MTGQKVRLRPATLDDAATLLAWRNDSLTRGQSETTDEVSLADHLRWMNWSLKDQFRRLYIALTEDGEMVGTARSDEVSTGNILSWTVAPELRGTGYGLGLAKALVVATPGRLKAHIKPQNIASRKIAEAVGMTLDSETEEMCFYGLIPADYVYDHLAVLRHL